MDMKPFEFNENEDIPILQNTVCSNECNSSPISGENNVSNYLKHVNNHGIDNDSSFFVSQIPLHEGALFLDVGYGCGILLKKLKNRQPNNSFVGIEYSLEMSRRIAPELNKIGIKTECIDYFHYFSKDKFDVILFSFVLHHFAYTQAAIEHAITLSRYGSYICMADRIPEKDDDIKLLVIDPDLD